MGMLTLLLACNGPDGGVPATTDRADDGPTRADPLPAGRLAGAAANEGFGARVTVGAETGAGVGTAVAVVASAPFAGPGDDFPAGRVGTWGGASSAGEDGALYGAGLVGLSDGTVLVGAPGAGRVTTLAGEVRLEEAGAGGVLAARGTAWATSTPVGAVTSTGARYTWDRRPDALALDGAGRLWAGFARGEVAVRAEGPDGATVVTRAATGDEAGFALLVADVDGDTLDELVVGAPGAGVVYVLDPDALPASLADVPAIGPGAGRFGAALAAGDATLFVGAPMAGTAVEGAAYAVRDGVVHEVAVGDPGDQLGAALAFARASLVIGAPGAADGPGHVRVVHP